MTHVFVSPHPDDIALSCGGLVAALRELGQIVTILTVFSGGSSTANGGMTDYQRAALGFGTKANWPHTEAFRRDEHRARLPGRGPAPAEAPPWMADPDRLDVTQDYANTQARQFWQRAAWTRSANITNEETDERPVADSIGGQGSLEVRRLLGAPTRPRSRRLEEERYAWFIEASVIFLDLPDAVYRGYEGDDQLLGGVRDDDAAPYELLRSEIVRLEPQMVYFPLGVGGHVDHQLCREVGLVAARRAAGAGSCPARRSWAALSFYEDFPYAWWNDFTGPTQGAGLWARPAGRRQLEAAVQRTSATSWSARPPASALRSQLPRLFESDQGLLDDLPATTPASRWPAAFAATPSATGRRSSPDPPA